MNIRLRDDGRPYGHDFWHAHPELQGELSYAAWMNATADVRDRIIDKALGKTTEDTRPPTPAANPSPPAARPTPSAEQVAEAIASIEQRRRELGLETTRQDERPAVPTGDLEQNIVDIWKTNASVRAEFLSLETYAAFRQGIAAGRIGGFDSHGEKLTRTDPVALSIRQADEEDRSAGVDPRLPIETRAEQVYNLNAQVRAEFKEAAAYTAWRKRVERSRG